MKPNKCKTLACAGRLLVCVCTIQTCCLTPFWDVTCSSVSRYLRFGTKVTSAFRVDNCSSVSEVLSSYCEKEASGKLVNYLLVGV